MEHKRIVTALFTMILLIPAGFSQDLDALVSRYTEKNGPGYMQPLADATGSVFNSGFFHGANMKKLGFQAYLGIITSAAFIPEKNKTFEAVTEGFFTPEQTAEAPTVFGPAKAVSVDGDGGTVYVFSGGLNVNMVPFAIPQLTLGSVYGTDVTFRFFSYSFEKDIGDLTQFSWGIRHSISQYVPDLPLDIAAAFYNSYFKVGTYIDCSSWMISAQASKRILIFTFYGGIGYESSKLNIDYHDEDTSIAYDLKGNNSVRLTAGITFNLGPVKLNADYNLASQSSFSAGLGIGIGDE